MAKYWQCDENGEPWPCLLREKEAKDALWGQGCTLLLLMHQESSTMDRQAKAVSCPWGCPASLLGLVPQMVYSNFLPLSHWPAETPHSLLCDLILRLVRSDCSALTGDGALCWPGFRPSETHSCISSRAVQCHTTMLLPCY